MSSRSLRQRLSRLERLPRFQPPPPPPSGLQQIRRRAVRQLSDEESDLLVSLIKREMVGEKIETLSQAEVAAIQRFDELLDLEARHMGFESFAHVPEEGEPERGKDAMGASDSYARKLAT